MKKIAFIGIAVATAMGFTACQKENLTEGQQSSSLVKETFFAGFMQTDTKTTVSDDGATVTWAAGDKVYYYTADGGTERNFTIAAAGASASLTLEREEGDTYYNLLYAGNTEPTFTTKTGTSMIFDGVKSSQDGTFQSANISVGRTTPGGSGITFKPVTALVKFTTARTDIKTIVLTGGNGEKVAGNISVDPTAASPVATLSGTGENSITVTIATPAAGTYYIGVIPGTYAQGLKLTLKNTSDAVIGTVTASKSTDLSAGDSMINYGDVDSHIVPPVLLSGKFSVSATKQVQFTRGNLYWDGTAWGLEAAQTDYPTAWSTSHVGHLFWTKDAANSYAASYNESASAATTDKFFADGSDASHSLTIEGQSGLYALSKDEWAYLISTRTSASSLYKYGVTVTDGGTSYANCLIIAPDDYSGTALYDITDWSLSNINSLGLVCFPAAGSRTDPSEAETIGYYLSSTPNKSDSNGACCLNIDGAGVDLPDGHGRDIGYSVRLVKGTVSYPEAPALTCVKIGDVTWAPVNCGYDATNAPTGLFYQWGRKYGQSASATFNTTQAKSMEEGNKEANKDKFYKGNACWFSGSSTKDTWKSEYNPCPAGWRVPTYNELNALFGSNISGWTENVGGQNGFYFNGTSSCTSSTSGNKVFLPAAGCWVYSSGYISFVTSYGYYWSSSPDSGSNISASRMKLYNGSAQITKEYRAFGFSVRCVQE